MIQLVVAVSTVTLVLVTDVESILGLGPAIFLTCSALGAFPAGRQMDRVGRVPVIAGGFLCAAVGCALVAAGCRLEAAALVVLGYALAGAAAGAIQLIRTAAADMVPPERRARAVSRVLVGALLGAALGPLVFRPLLAGRELESAALVGPWLAAAGFALLGMLLALAVRPDPRTYALALARLERDGASDAPAEPLRRILSRPGVAPALVGSVASFAVMVGVMNLAGYLVVDHGRHQGDVFTVISAHIAGMYALVLGIGEFVDRVGRRVSLVGGLALMAVSTLMLVWASSVLWTSVALFLLGLGWNLGYVAAAAELVTRAGPVERGRIVGLADLLGAGLGATLALGGGALYTVFGVTTLSLVATAAVVAPALWILGSRRVPESAPTAA
jgi:MFS family permease